MTYREQITIRLTEAKTRSGKSLVAISLDSNISLSTIQQYFYNAVMPSADKLGPLCKVLGVSADWVLGIEKETFPLP